MVNYKNALEVKNLNKSFMDFSLKDISFTIPKGYVMGLVGTNASGKSTIIKLIMDILKADSGEIKFFDLPYKNNEIMIKENIGFVYDESPYFEEYTIEKNKNLISPFYPTWEEKIYKHYIRKFKLNEMLKLKELSKGQKIKFQLIMALSHKPKLLIMDEPTAGLDPIYRAEFLDILFEILKEEELSILLCTHIISDLENLADYITCIDNGRLIFSLEKSLLFEKYSIVKLPKESFTKDLESLFLTTKELSYSYEGFTDKLSVIKEKFGDKLIYEPPTLEDIIINLIKLGGK